MKFIKYIGLVLLWGTGGLVCAQTSPGGGQEPAPLMGKRILTFMSVIRVNQLEVTRDRNVGKDEAEIHTVESVSFLRDNFEKAFPGGRMTWSLSWHALHDQRENYQAIRKLVTEYHRKYGDEITFIPGGYAAMMYNPREQVNRDLHEGLKLVSEMVGDGYRPKSVIAGFLSAENQRYLAEVEGIHVCQGMTFSQYGIDKGSGDGSFCYPYYPSREHFCKPAQGPSDFIDSVCLDGWSMDFLPGRRFGFTGGLNSRLGLGPIEVAKYNKNGDNKGVQEQLHTVAIYFDDGFKRNGFGYTTVNFEVSVGNLSDRLPELGAEMRRRWPDMQCWTLGEFGEAFRAQFKDNSKLDYRFVERGSGIGGSEPNLEIRWFMNRDFRLALLRDWTGQPNPDFGGREKVIDFTRYDLKAQEPPDTKPGEHQPDWSLVNRINQKQLRPQDKPVCLEKLPAEDQDIIRHRLPELFAPAGK